MQSYAYSGVGDLQRMIDALMAWRMAHPAGDYEHAGDLLWAMRRQETPERTIRLWYEGERLTGFVVIDPEWGVLLHEAGPEAPTELRRALFEWGLERLRQIAREGETITEIIDQVREDNAAKIAFLEAQGFARTDSSVVELLCSLAGQNPDPLLPDGFTIRSLAGEAEVPAYVDMHRDAWSVWAPSTYSVEQHLRVMRNPGYDCELNPVVVAPDGRIVAACIGWLDPVNRIGEIEPLGTRPAFARMGLARAVVTELLRRMRTRGMETALVYGSHANEPARELYRSLGFEAGRTIYTYCRQLE